MNDLWNYIQQDPFYKDQTALLVTVDHGRGEGDQWASHGPKITHSNEIWFAVIAPGKAAKGEVKAAADIYQYQFAATVAKLLGVTYKTEQPTGPVIPELMEK